MMKNILILCLPGLFAVVVGCSDSSTDSRHPDLSYRIIRVPADISTIQAAIDSSGARDTILVADGFYTGEGNRDLTFRGRSRVLKSENGPGFTIIDCEGNSSFPHAGFIFEEAADWTVIDGFTIMAGYANQGGAVLCNSASPTFKNCIFSDNQTVVSGGAIWCKSSSVKFENCTFVGNSSPAGGAVFVSAGSSPRFENCIIAYSTSGGALETLGAVSDPVLSCCLLFGNVGGDWVGAIAEQAGQNGNISADPRFCDYNGSDLRLQSSSLCAPANNSCGELIGARDVGCSD